MNGPYILFECSNEKLYFCHSFAIFQCCAVSFIENLTAESLNMPADEFENYMNGDVVSTSTWESALVICEVSYEFRFQSEVSPAKRLLSNDFLRRICS